jgi:hypothetical protein
MPTEFAEQPHEIEEILDMRIMNGRQEYFVKYVGLPITRCEWVNPYSIESARHKFEDFNCNRTLAGKTQA